ncbi:MAG: SufD family Fe-S cluster assembly protein [Clostridiaceae bacterium]|nr:SufD family Fe-S cluster assembly protein [Clostridiaceae bacterium]
MSQFEATINRIPVRTWGRLHVNDAELVLGGPDGVSFTDSVNIHGSGKVIINQSFGDLAIGEDATKMFVPAEMGMFIDENANRRYLIRIPRNHTEQDPIVLTLHLDEKNPFLVDDIVIEAEEGSNSTVIIKYSSEAGVPARHCGRTRVQVRRNAGLKLVKVQMLGGEASHSEAIGGTVQEGARLDVIVAELGAVRPLSSCNLILKGEKAAAGLDVVYLGAGQRSLDMTYRVEHRGKETVSNICAKGILLEQSHKVFRDTLDFISGASGSKGREEESVLMLSPEVRNVSVPLLLCGEDDVEGEHAASSGRPDDKILFYLMSRGIGELEAQKLLAQAAVSSIVEKIPDPSARDEILDIVRRSIKKGGKTA